MSGPPFTMSKYASELDLLRDKCAWLERQVASKQARIDALMLEYCPDEMTAEQTAEWARHQVPVSAEEGQAIRAALGPSPRGDNGNG